MLFSVRSEFVDVHAADDLNSPCLLSSRFPEAVDRSTVERCPLGCHSVINIRDE